MQFRLALFVSALLAVFSLGAASAFASGDDAILPGSQFRLNPYTLEPGCYRADHITDVDSPILFDNGIAEEAHITVSDGATVSVDQVLVPDPNDGYRVVNSFDTGTVNNDPDIDPGQTATGLRSGGQWVDNHDIIVCVSQHPDGGQNEPYLQQAGGEVAAKNRPTITPTITGLGLSAIGDLHTFKVGFGYTTSWYADPNSLFDPLFPVGLTDPQLRFGGNYVEIDARPDQAGVRRATTSTWRASSAARLTLTRPITARRSCSARPATRTARSAWPRTTAAAASASITCWRSTRRATCR